MDVVVPYSVRIPKWTNIKAAPSADQAEWKRIMMALETHEQGHVNRYLAHQVALETAIKQSLDGKTVILTEVPCPNDPRNPTEAFKNALDAAVRTLANNNMALTNLFASIETEQAKFDTDTKHGATQGATLNCH